MQRLRPSLNAQSSAATLVVTCCIGSHKRKCGALNRIFAGKPSVINIFLHRNLLRWQGILLVADRRAKNKRWEGQVLLAKMKKAKGS
ncbi:hypothetical protein CMV_006243 [Castanea mollissima]|uniref:Uncharacterized protein n=1 Tax=Castanea mollissima TaxID=60419 RepID=A0A8J4VRF1_9ROSI|nr:hypothetical protein CMV_006243 [Castanea mollissima]